MDKEENATGDGDHEEASGYARAVGPEEEIEEDVEDNEDEEVEEDMGDEEVNVLSFIDGINPLDFVEDDGDQLYQRLLGTDYEALAERKRKELVDSRPEGSAKKARKEDLTGVSMEEIMEAMNYM